PTRASVATATTTGSAREAGLASPIRRGGGAGLRASGPRATAAGARARPAARPGGVRGTRGVRRLPPGLERELQQVTPRRRARRADARRDLARPGDDGGALLPLPSGRALGLRAARASQGARRRGVVPRLSSAPRHARALAAARRRAADVLPLPRRGGGPVRLRAHRAHARGLRELPRAARQREPPPAALPAGRPTLLPVSRRDAGEPRAAELSRLHALPHSDPRLEQPGVLPG